MLVKTKITTIINASLHDTFVWFDHSENYSASPIVFSSRWRKVRYLPGARRDIIMIAGWYSEVITQRQPDRLIQYRVLKSLPKVRQDFTQISFTPLNENLTHVEWTVELELPTHWLANLAIKTAHRLYHSILMAGKKNLEKQHESKQKR